MDAFWTAKLMQIAGGAIGGVVGVLLFMGIAKLLKLEEGKFKSSAKFAPILFIVLGVQTVNILNKQNNNDRVAVILNEMVVMQQAQEREMLPLIEKFNALPIGDSLRAETLTNMARISESKKVFGEFVLLVKEREAMLAKQWSEHEGRISRIEDSKIRSEAMGAFSANKSKLSQMYADLENAQLSFVNTSVELLNFSETLVGLTSVKDGQIIFQKQEHLDKFEDFMRKLTVLEKQEAEKTRAINQFASENEKTVQQTLSRIK